MAHTPTSSSPHPIRLSLADILSSTDRNAGTRVSVDGGMSGLAGLGVLADAERFFRRHYREMRSHFAGRREGIGAYVVDRVAPDHGVRGWTEQRPGELASLVLGRHDCCDLELPQPSVSNRQLLLLRDREPGAFFRMFSLEPRRPVCAPDGQQLAAALAEGVAIFLVDRYVVFAATTGPHGPKWDASGDGVWSLFARTLEVAQLDVAGDAREEREVPRAPDIFLPAPRAANEEEVPKRHSTVVSVAAPVHDVPELRVPGESLAYVLKFSRPGRETLSLAAGRDTLRRGVLLGRLSRCTVRLQHRSLSRVHALLIEIRGELLLIETGSSAGLYVRAPDARDVLRERRIVSLAGPHGGDEAVLGDDILSVRALRG